jgi:hypothetical protein
MELNYMESLGSLLRKRNKQVEKSTQHKKYCCNCGDTITTKFPCKGHNDEYYCDGCIPGDY